MVEGTLPKGESRTGGYVVGWPRWMSGVMIVTGLIVIVTETTSLLLFAGIMLVGFGAYGLAWASRIGRINPTREASRAIRAP
jgi:hypothetical protein